jgi:hypothetical protein
MSIKQCNVSKDNHQDYFLLDKYVGGKNTNRPFEHSLFEYEIIRFYDFIGVISLTEGKTVHVPSNHSRAKERTSLNLWMYQPCNKS